MIGQPLLESDRLILRVPQRDDYLLLRDLMAHPQVQQFLGPPADNPTADMFSRGLRGAGSWQLYGYGMFMMLDKASGAFLGQAGIFQTLRGFGKGLDDVPEAAWMLAYEHWGKGYAREAMELALGWFDAEHAADRIACMIEPENTASVRLAHHLGFVRYDTHVLPDGVDINLYERLRPKSL